MRSMTADEIRETFIEFFSVRGHQRVNSGPLVPQDDPTLLFTNAGMVQFKDIFLGQRASSYSRAVTAQKCVRAGGKHNDLDNVGRTARHHTFFEMLGNFSFGDYFKREAVEYAWELLTSEYAVPSKSLWITVFRDDDQAAGLWREIAGVPEDRIVRLGEADNFWSMGETGPCGPCSEIIYDRGSEYSCGEDPCMIGECDCDRWLEIWNLVFMQYERDAEGNMTPLKQTGVDTGLGLERMAAVLQGVDSNYDTDLFVPLIEAVESLSGRTYGESEEEDMAIRVISDHVRTSVFLISEGVIPANEGRGYVLRRILRRACRFGRVLGLDEPFLYRLVGSVVEIMAGAYRELDERCDYVQEAIWAEEERFGAALKQGSERLEQVIARTRESGASEISARDAFTLYDTFGFPIDLCEDAAREAGLSVDRSGFNELLDQQREQARRARREAGVSDEITGILRMLADVAETEFAGYETTELAAEVLVVIAGEQRTGRLDHGEEGWVILDRTPFYAEAGGQVGDHGSLKTREMSAQVEDAQPLGDGKIIHRVRVSRGVLEEGAEVAAVVDSRRRHDVARNHTATHLLHGALRELLGDHVRQAGSLVAPDRLRFDFAHHSAITQDQMRDVETWVNERILDSLLVRARHTEYERALDEGAVALFGERYGEGDVRVVRIGEVSSELCGGTHVSRTSEVGSFKLTYEGSIGSGLRRVEAVTGWGAVHWMWRQEDLQRALEQALDASPEDLESRVEELQQDLRSRQRRVQQLESRLEEVQVRELQDQARLISDVAVLSAQVEAPGADGLRHMADSIRGRFEEAAVLLAAVSDGRAVLIGAATDGAVAKGAHMGKVVRDLGRELGGGGGGRPDMAQGGGDRIDRLEGVLQLGAEMLETMLGKGHEES